ncbi:878_t:CDS:10 [Paraglomus occultum]|uniref:tRNA-dihydrouridine(47) synthase [NAD(P)(+)] n=1 Tax=Paraglomus occultum TaxID=144539 RepID=A0A9N8ZIA0_9GLOM|nr:878_t:CDS:10 [Paraglomus occultum]
MESTISGASDTERSTTPELNQLKRAAPSDRKGVAPIKSEYLIKAPQEERLTDETVFGDDAAVEPPKKKTLVTRQRGQAKEHLVKTFSENIRLCLWTAQGEECPNNACRSSHDLAAYMKDKAEDLGDRCVNYETFGKCRYGYKCRYLKAHISSDGKLLVNKELAEKNIVTEINSNIPLDTYKQLRTFKYKFPKSEPYLKEVQQTIDARKEMDEANRKKKKNLLLELFDPSELENNVAGSTDTTLAKSGIPIEAENVSSSLTEASQRAAEAEQFADTPDVPLKPAEKKRISFKNKLYLAPLTTVGNLPFRRICKEFGADITCGEMAMATNILKGQKSEWTLMKRHVSEDIFGVQICGSKVDHVVRCAEVIGNELDVDFVDLNTGCPIDLVFSKGGGSALLREHGKLGKMLVGMQRVLDIPVTIKLRTGIDDKKPTAEKLVPKLEKWGIALASLHGRSRQQRYTKLADWDYISKVSSTIEEYRKTDKINFFGNGDLLSYEDYYQHMNEHNVDGVLVGRGALVKPWLFEEIKTRRNWDISSRERFDILKKYCDYGLEYWGTDSVAGRQYYTQILV